MAYKVRYEDEPRGEAHNEPREDGLDLIVIDGEPRYWQKPNGKRACGAKTRDWDPPSNWTRCRQTRIDPDNHRCRNHGGQSLRGVASPSWEGKGRSQYLPDALGDRMDDFMKDPNIASVREDLALADVRLSMKLEQMETAETGERWEKLEEKVDVLSDALTEGDTDTASAALSEIQEIVKEGAEAEESWDEVFDIMEQKRKLAETENKRIKASSNTLTVEEASMLVDVMVSLMQDVAERYDLPNQALRDINEATRDLLDT